MRELEREGRKKEGLTLLLSLVSQHRSEGNISDALDSLDGGVVLIVDNDSALSVELDTDGLEVESVGDGSSTNSDEDNVGGKLKSVDESRKSVKREKEEGRRARERVCRAGKEALTVSFFPSLTPSTSIVTVFPSREALMTLVLSLNLKPCLVRIFWKFLL